ncbi:hypothetical protein [Erwinia persicina]|uniref:Uncharacterized protein n=1 Tax=Erwinia persicina TaxID=55211 RepID=A0A4U3FL12_9GAMM|nr:hypothetical protein [Erwinia persicina]TKJ94813.1 hypothetical protein EpCFBP13511_00150 [Erwinia persicina]
MNSFNDQVYLILTKAEAEGALGFSSTANKILDIAKVQYQSSDEKGKQEVVDKIESLKAQPGVSFPQNYLALLQS